MDKIWTNSVLICPLPVHSLSIPYPFPVQALGGGQCLDRHCISGHWLDRDCTYWTVTGQRLYLDRGWTVIGQRLDRDWIFVQLLSNQPYYRSTLPSRPTPNLKSFCCDENGKWNKYSQRRHQPKPEPEGKLRRIGLATFCLVDRFTRKMKCTTPSNGKNICR